MTYQDTKTQKPLALFLKEGEKDFKKSEKTLMSHILGNYTDETVQISKTVDADTGNQNFVVLRKSAYITIINNIISSDKNEHNL